MSDQVNVQQIIDDYIQDILYMNPVKQPDYVIHPLIQNLVGPVKRGLKMHLYGRPSSGKTALAASLAAWAALNNEKVLWIDASFNYPECFLAEQIPVEYQQNVAVTRTFTPKSLVLFPKFYHLIIVDDTDNFMVKAKRQIIPFASVCSRCNCSVVFISQVRRDIFQSGDLVPETAITNSDLTINTVRSELLSEQECRFRYTAMIKGYRGRFLHRNYSFEADYLGVDLMHMMLDMSVKNKIIKKNGVLLSYDGANLGGINIASRKYRFNFDLIKELHEKVLEATNVSGRMYNPTGQTPSDDEGM